MGNLDEWRRGEASEEKIFEMLYVQREMEKACTRNWQEDSKKRWASTREKNHRRNKRI